MIFISLLEAFSEDEGDVHEINSLVMNSNSDDDSNDNYSKLLHANSYLTGYWFSAFEFEED